MTRAQASAEAALEQLKTEYRAAVDAYAESSVRDHASGKANGNPYYESPATQAAGAKARKLKAELERLEQP